MFEEGALSNLKSLIILRREAHSAEPSLHDTTGTMCNPMAWTGTEISSLSIRNHSNSTHALKGERVFLRKKTKAYKGEGGSSKNVRTPMKFSKDRYLQRM